MVKVSPVLVNVDGDIWQRYVEIADETGKIWISPVVKDAVLWAMEFFGKSVLDVRESLTERDKSVSPYEYASVYTLEKWFSEFWDTSSQN